MGGGNLSWLLVDSTTVSKVDPGFGFHAGGSLGLMLSPRWEMELGGFYLSRAINAKNYNGTTTEHFVEVPLVARYYVSEAFSVSGGLYAAFGTGNVTSTVNGSSQSSTFDASNLNSFEFGTQLGLRLQHYILESTSLFLEGRYEVGIQKATSDDSRLNYELIALLGVQMGF
jgi:hypothetical protein